MGAAVLQGFFKLSHSALPPVPRPSTHPTRPPTAAMHAAVAAAAMLHEVCQLLDSNTLIRLSMPAFCPHTHPPQSIHSSNARSKGRSNARSKGRSNGCGCVSEVIELLDSDRLTPLLPTPCHPHLLPLTSTLRRQYTAALAAAAAVSKTLDSVKECRPHFHTLPPPPPALNLTLLGYS
jgi:hypothetical protein